jgi:hypothetical protein
MNENDGYNIKKYIIIEKYVTYKKTITSKHWQISNLEYLIISYIRYKMTAKQNLYDKGLYATRSQWIKNVS